MADQRHGIELARSFDSPFIRKIFEVSETQDELQVLAELAENGMLQDYIHPDAPLPESLALKIVYTVAKGLEQIHDQGVVQRGLAPSNLLFDSEFRVKFGDFHQSKRLASGQRRASIVGEFEYMSPEVAHEAGHSLKTDIWSLGCLLYELIEGGLIRQACLPGD